VQISGIMTPNPRTVQPGDTLQAAAQAMDELNVGVLPVCEGDRLVGLVTDRDIVIRSVSAGQDPRTATVADAMTTDPRTLSTEDSVMDALRMMKEQQLRRVPVLDGQGKLAGIVSLGDLAASGTPEAGDALEAISIPAEPDR
jgi:CBS domain-containing protein